MDIDRYDTTSSSRRSGADGKVIESGEKGMGGQKMEEERTEDSRSKPSFERLALEFRKLSRQLEVNDSSLCRNYYNNTDIADLARVQIALTERTQSNPLYIPPVDLVRNMDRYPSVAHSFGGSLPLNALSNRSVVVVQSSNVWRQAKYAYPKSMPSFNKFCILNDKELF
jgi:hypothetical protein